MLFSPMVTRVRAMVLLAALAGACGGGDDENAPWEIVERDLPGALISVWGSSETDIWVVGGDPGGGAGPEVLHYDGTTWTTLSTGESGDLWWVFGFPGGPVFMGGAGGMIM